jgi:hypothetical protein
VGEGAGRAGRRQHQGRLDRGGLAHRFAGERPVEHRADGPEIGACVHREPEGLLRGHVRGRPAGGAGLRGQRRGGVAGLDAGDAKIEHLQGAVAQDHQVLGLDIPVDDPFLVGGLEGGEDLLDQLDGAPGGEPPFPGEEPR